MNMTTLDKARALLDAMRRLPGPLVACEHSPNRGDEIGPNVVRAWRLFSETMDCAIADDLDESAAEALVDLHNFAADVAMAYLALVERLGELTAIAGLDERRPTATRRQRRATQPPPVAPAPAGGGGGGPGATVHVVTGTPQVTPPGARKLADAGLAKPVVTTDAPPAGQAEYGNACRMAGYAKGHSDGIAQAEAALAPPPLLDTPVPGRADPFEVAGRKLAAVATVLASVREGLAAVLGEATEVDAAGKMVIPEGRIGQFVILQQVRDQLAAALEVHPNPDPREPAMTTPPAQSTA